MVIFSWIYQSSSISGGWKTFFDCVESKTSEIFVEKSPAEPGDEVHREGGKEHHKVCGRVLGANGGHSHDDQGPHTQRGKAGGETKAKCHNNLSVQVDIFMVKINVLCNYTICTSSLVFQFVGNTSIITPPSAARRGLKENGQNPDSGSKNSENQNNDTVL